VEAQRIEFSGVGLAAKLEGLGISS
jgi:hypothetical protein